MKVLCLNVGSGGGSRWGRILDFVEAHEPDVVVFAEWRAGVRPGKAETWPSSRDMKSAFANDGATKNGGVRSGQRRLHRDQRDAGERVGWSVDASPIRRLGDARLLFPAIGSKGSIFRCLPEGGEGLQQPATPNCGRHEHRQPVGRQDSIRREVGLQRSLRPTLAEGGCCRPLAAIERSGRARMDMVQHGGQRIPIGSRLRKRGVCGSFRPQLPL